MNLVADRLFGMLFEMLLGLLFGVRISNRFGLPLGLLFILIPCAGWRNLKI